MSSSSAELHINEDLNNKIWQELFKIKDDLKDELKTQYDYIISLNKKYNESKKTSDTEKIADMQLIYVKQAELYLKHIESKTLDMNTVIYKPLIQSIYSIYENKLLKIKMYEIYSELQRPIKKKYKNISIDYDGKIKSIIKSFIYGLTIFTSIFFIIACEINTKITNHFNFIRFIFSILIIFCFFSAFIIFIFFTHWYGKSTHSIVYYIKYNMYWILYLFILFCVLMLSFELSGFHSYLSKKPSNNFNSNITQLRNEDPIFNWLIVFLYGSISLLVLLNIGKLIKYSKFYNFKFTSKFLLTFGGILGVSVISIIMYFTYVLNASPLIYFLSIIIGLIIAIFYSVLNIIGLFDIKNFVSEKDNKSFSDIIYDNIINPLINIYSMEKLDTEPYLNIYNNIDIDLLCNESWVNVEEYILCNKNKMNIIIESLIINNRLDCIIKIINNLNNEDLLNCIMFYFSLQTNSNLKDIKTKSNIAKIKYICKNLNKSIIDKYGIIINPNDELSSIEILNLFGNICLKNHKSDNYFTEDESMIDDVDNGGIDDGIDGGSDGGSEGKEDDSSEGEGDGEGDGEGEVEGDGDGDGDGDSKSAGAGEGEGEGEDEGDRDGDGDGDSKSAGAGEGEGAGVGKGEGVIESKTSDDIPQLQSGKEKEPVDTLEVAHAALSEATSAVTTAESAIHSATTTVRNRGFIIMKTTQDTLDLLSKSYSEAAYEANKAFIKARNARTLAEKQSAIADAQAAAKTAADASIEAQALSRAIMAALVETGPGPGAGAGAGAGASAGASAGVSSSDDTDFGNLIVVKECNNCGNYNPIYSTVCFNCGQNL